MRSHIVIAHARWQELLSKGDTAIDATLGNGNDTLFLASIMQGEGRLIGYDIQETAIEKTLHLLQELPSSWRKNVVLKQISHTALCEPAKLIVYNLGYLPGSDKSITTMTETTLVSLDKAVSLLQPGGLLSITCYPGHSEGAREAKAVLAWAQTQKISLEIFETRGPFVVFLRSLPS
ncbi:MAG: class I SAM-dependent methyltransferase [Chlamydiales bacterium]